MTCGLSQDELDFLYYMYVNRRITPSRTKSYEKLKQYLGNKLKFLYKIFLNNFNVPVILL